MDARLNAQPGAGRASLIKGALLAAAALSGIALTASAQTPPPSNSRPRRPENITDATPIAAYLAGPSATISNGQVSAKIYLPDAQKGFYRGVRFDWAGVLGGLTYQGHDFYRPWFNAVSPSVRDFVIRDGQVIVGPNTGANGPVEEFNAEGGALGYAEAAPGGLFLKIGVGVLRRIDATPFNFTKPFPLVDPGKRTQKIGKDSAEFTQVVADPGTGYAYSYTKTLRLLPGQPVLVIEHVLKNTGSKVIATSVYDHNFLNIDGKGTQKGLALATPFAFNADPKPNAALATLNDHGVVYQASLASDQRVQFNPKGFGATAGDNDFTIADPSSGAGLRVQGDQPLDHVALWSIQPVMAIEPFIKMTIKPGESFSWSYRYSYQAGLQKRAALSAATGVSQ